MVPRRPVVKETQTLLQELPWLSTRQKHMHVRPSQTATQIDTLKTKKFKWSTLLHGNSHGHPSLLSTHFYTKWQDQYWIITQTMQSWYAHWNDTGFSNPSKENRNCFCSLSLPRLSVSPQHLWYHDLIRNPKQQTARMSTSLSPSPGSVRRGIFKRSNCNTLWTSPSHAPNNRSRSWTYILVGIKTWNLHKFRRKDCKRLCACRLRTNHHVLRSPEVVCRTPVGIICMCCFWTMFNSLSWIT